MLPLDRRNDDDVVGHDSDEELSHEMSLQPDESESILQSVDKVLFLKIYIFRYLD